MRRGQVHGFEIRAADIGLPHLLVEAYYFKTVRGVIMSGALK